MVDCGMVGIFLGIAMCERFWTWVVTMVDGMEDEGMDCGKIGMVEEEIEIFLLFFASKFGSIIKPFCKDVVGMEDKSGVSQKDSTWVWLLIGSYVIAEYYTWLVNYLSLRNLSMASTLASTYCSNSSMDSSYVGSSITWVIVVTDCSRLSGFYRTYFMVWSMDGGIKI